MLIPANFSLMKMKNIHLSRKYINKLMTHYFFWNILEKLPNLVMFVIFFFFFNKNLNFKWWPSPIHGKSEKKLRRVAISRISISLHCNQEFKKICINLKNKDPFWSPFPMSQLLMAIWRIRENFLSNKLKKTYCRAGTKLYLNI